MLGELLAYRLEVVLIPSQDDDCAMRGGMIRAVQEQNAEWYRTFCAQFASHRKYRGRKFKTKIKRQHTIRALNELAEGYAATIYAERLRDFIKEQQRK